MNDRTCCMCGASLEGRRSDAMMCSQKCRKAKWDRDNLERKREHGRLYSERHREELSRRQRESRKADPEPWRARDKRFRQGAKSKAWWASYQRDKVVKAKSDREYRIANRERISEAWNKWAKQNRHRTTAYNQKRSAAKADAEGIATPAQVQARIDYYGGTCWICQIAPYESIDHVKPLAQGGCNWPANLRPACRSCNSSKRHTWPFAPEVRKIA